MSYFRADVGDALRLTNIFMLLCSEGLIHLIANFSLILSIYLVKFHIFFNIIIVVYKDYTIFLRNHVKRVGSSRNCINKKSVDLVNGGNQIKKPCIS